MREIDVKRITEKVRDLCIEANTDLGEDVFEAFDRAMAVEDPPVFLKERHYENYYTNKAWRIIDTYFLREDEPQIVAQRLKRIMTGMT